MMFPHEMTLYHRTEEDGAVKWSRSVVQGVLWENLASITLRKTGITPEDKVQVYIPMPGAEVSEKDIIVKGICDTQIQKSSKEIPDGMYVTSVETYDYGNLKHWRVTAR